MIYFFSGNSEFLISEKVWVWKKNFLEKFWENNLVHIKNIWEYDISEIFDQIVWISLFSQKKLIIIEWIPVWSDQKNTDIIAKQEYILSQIERVNEENLLVFVSHNPDKRWKLYKYFIKQSKMSHSTVLHTLCDIENDYDIANIVNKKFPNLIDSAALWKLIRYKSWNMLKVISEIEKLSIIYNKIDNSLIEKIIVPELEESIFVFIDDLLNWNKSKSIQDIRIILEQSEIMPFYYWLVSNIRLAFYVSLHKKMWVKNSDIASAMNLWNRKFLIDKYSKYKYEYIADLYFKILSIDEKMKTGKLSNISSQPFIDELEVVILTNNSTLIYN